MNEEFSVSFRSGVLKKKRFLRKCGRIVRKEKYFTIFIVWFEREFSFFCMESSSESLGTVRRSA
jgi:hypothetical protein